MQDKQGTEDMEGAVTELRVAAKAVIVNDKGEVLIIREATTYEEGTQHGRYELPGGRIHAHESFFEGLQREVREETGLSVSIVRPVYVDEWFPAIKGTRSHIVAMFMLCRLTGGTIRLSEEHDDWKWIEPESRYIYDLIPNVSAAIGSLLVSIHL